MSAIFQDASAQLILADYAATDMGGKLNVVGGAVTMFGVTPTGATAPFHVAALMSFNERFAGEQYSLTFELRDEANAVVMLPGPAGPPQAMRIQQLAIVEPVQVPPGVQKPVAIRSSAQVILAFPTGLPLQPGSSFRWKVLIDGQSRRGWEAPFSVMSALPGPVFGGPAAQGHLEGIEDLSSDVPDEPDS